MEVARQYSLSDVLDGDEVVDVSSLAREFGIACTTELSFAVWKQFIAVSEGVSRQNETGRAWHLLWMFYDRIRRERRFGSELTFEIYASDNNGAPTPVTLKAVFRSYGDADGLAITIMLPDEK